MKRNTYVPGVTRWEHQQLKTPTPDPADKVVQPPPLYGVDSENEDLLKRLDAVSAGRMLMGCLNYGNGPSTAKLLIAMHEQGITELNLSGAVLTKLGCDTFFRVMDIASPRLIEQIDTLNLEFAYLASPVTFFNACERMLAPQLVALNLTNTHDMSGPNEGAPSRLRPAALQALIDVIALCPRLHSLRLRGQTALSMGQSVDSYRLDIIGTALLRSEGDASGVASFDIGDRAALRVFGNLLSSLSGRALKCLDLSACDLRRERMTSVWNALFQPPGPGATTVEELYLQDNPKECFGNDAVNRLRLLQSATPCLRKLACDFMPFHHDTLLTYEAIARHPHWEMWSPADTSRNPQHFYIDALLRERRIPPTGLQPGDWSQHPKAAGKMLARCLDRHQRLHALQVLDCIERRGWSRVDFEGTRIDEMGCHLLAHLMHQPHWPACIREISFARCTLAEPQRFFGFLEPPAMRLLPPSLQQIEHVDLDRATTFVGRNLLPWSSDDIISACRLMSQLPQLRSFRILDTHFRVPTGVGKLMAIKGRTGEELLQYLKRHCAH